MRILALDAALARCAAAVVVDGQVTRHAPGERIKAMRMLPVMAKEVLAEANLARRLARPDCRHRGPGQLHRHPRGTGAGPRHRAGAGVPIVGVTVGEALADRCRISASATFGTRSTAGAAGCSSSGTARSLPLRWTRCRTPTARSRWPAMRRRGRRPPGRARRGRHADRCAAAMARHVAVAGERRLRRALPPLPAQPLYVDPPEARLPAGACVPARCVTRVDRSAPPPCHAAAMAAIHRRVSARRGLG